MISKIIIDAQNKLEIFALINQTFANEKMKTSTEDFGEVNSEYEVVCNEVLIPEFVIAIFITAKNISKEISKIEEYGFDDSVNTDKIKYLEFLHKLTLSFASDLVSSLFLEKGINLDGTYWSIRCDNQIVIIEDPNGLIEQYPKTNKLLFQFRNTSIAEDREINEALEALTLSLFDDTPNDDFLEDNDIYNLQ